MRGGRDDAPADAPPTVNPTLNEEPAPEKTESPGSDAADEPVEPAPTALSGNGPAQPGVANDATPTPYADNAAAIETAPEPPAVSARQETPDADDVDPADMCLAYRAFLARNAEEEAVAADLNAIMLAELQSAGAACE